MCRILLLSLASVLIVATPAVAQDALLGVPRSPATPILGALDDREPCDFGALGAPLSLFEAITRTLCRNPKSRVAWATIKVKAAVVLSDKEAYLPTASGTWKDSRDEDVTSVTNSPELNTSYLARYRSEGLSLSWVLYDFGHRSAQLESDQQLLAAAQANLDADLQLVFLQAAKDYYDAQAAEASRDAAAQIEKFAKENEAAARQRVEHGVAAISDQLQAQTAYAQAVLNRVKASADFTTKLGALAIDMGISPDSHLILSKADETHINISRDFANSLHDLIEEAKSAHPSVILAAKELAAAEAAERAARNQYYPTISLFGQGSHSTQPLSPGLGSLPVLGANRDLTLGLEVDVPLSDELWKRGQIEQARAQVEVQRESLNDAEQQVAQEVWNSYQALEADTDSLTVSNIVLKSAEQSFQATTRRYEGGVGNILELLSSQSAYANAQQQRIQAVSDWRSARLRLAASLGKLGMWAIEMPNKGTQQ